MKREGRQHGLVATCPIILSSQQDVIPSSSRKNKLVRQPTAGNYTKVSRKPTNQSKYTSRCSRPGCSSCHICPTNKAKDKTKGTHKLRSSDVVTNYRLLTWRVVDATPGIIYSGFSAASEILDGLDNYEDQIEDEIDDGEAYETSTTHPIKEEEEKEAVAAAEENCDYNNSREEEDEGWCLVPRL